MELSEFKQILGRDLFAWYRDRYSDIGINELFKKIGTLKESELISIITNVRQTSPTFFPPAASVEVAAKSYLERHNQDSRQGSLRSHNRCKLCDSTGFVEAYKKDKPLAQSYAFRCRECGCADALGLSRGIPEWRDRYKESFIPLSRTQISKPSDWDDVIGERA